MAALAISPTLMPGPAPYAPSFAPQTVTQDLETLGAVLSPSQVRCLMDCSARWYYKYALGIEEPKNGNLALGIAVHHAIAYHFSAKIDNRGVEPPAGDALSQFGHAWKAVSLETEFRDDENPAELEAQGLKLTEKYLREAAPSIQPAAVEVEVSGVIAGVRVQGRLDVIETNGTVRDVKTSSRKSDSVSNEQRFQLATYVPFAAGATGEVVIDQLVKTVKPQLIHLTHTITAGDIAATEQMYPLAQAFMRGQLYMPNRTSNLCSRRNCCYWRKCQGDFGGTVSAS